MLLDFCYMRAVQSVRIHTAPRPPWQVGLVLVKRNAVCRADLGRRRLFHQRTAVLTNSNVPNLKTMGFRIDFDRLRYFTDHLDNYPLHRQKGWYYKKWELSGYSRKEISDEAARELITR